jgi:curved DNA-binding protein CbpA
VRNFYKVLGIASTADDGRVKSAFRRRAKAFHPDLNPGDRDAEERFKELTQAYEVLRSAHARATYDALLARRRSDVRRRFVSSAAMMAASFVLTLGSAYAVLSLHDGGSQLREGWQLAMASMRVGSDSRPEGAVVAPANAAPPAVDALASATEVARLRPAGTDVAPAALEELTKAGPQNGRAFDGRPPSARGRKPAPDAAQPAKATSRVATAGQRKDPAATDTDHRAPSDVPGETNWGWLTAGEPRMSLGAGNR